MSDPGAPAQASSLPGWQGILDPDEQILWQGQPDGRFRIEFDSLRESLPGLLMLAFALFWMYQAAQASVFFALFGLFFVVLGLRQLLSPVIWPAYLRSRSWYTLTDRRAFIATEVLGRKTLRDWPVDPETLLDYDGALPGTIWFSEEGARRRPFGRRRRVGFELLPDARQVHALMRKVQRRQA